jgi:hypothetical protein
MSGLHIAALVVSVVGTACWPICFWWMHRLSVRQESMLAELHEVTGRIERLTREEHELIRDVQPDVEQIKERVTKQDQNRTGTDHKAG